MNRIQKKCLVVSVGIHLLLAVMLIFGAAFLSRPDENAPPLLKFVPYETVDALVSGGGDKSMKAPPAQEQAPEPPVTPTPIVTPPPPVTPPPVEPTPVVKEPPHMDNTPKMDLSPVKPAPRPRQINPDLTVKTSGAADAKAKKDAQAKAAAARQQQIAAAFGRATTGIRHGVSGGVEVKVSPGIGTGGVSYGNIQSAIYTKYYEAWKVPDGAPDLKVYVSITLARDGTVVTARITQRSGNTDLDDSVQKALDRVKFVAPLPDGEKADTRDFEFNFKPEMKSAE